MSEVLDKLVVGVLLAVVTAIVGLFVRVRQLENKRAAADERLKSLEGRGSSAPAVKELGDRVERNEKALADHRLESERRFLTRDDWVPVMSQVIGRLEKQGEAIARIDEFIRLKGER